MNRGSVSEEKEPADNVLHRVVSIQLMCAFCRVRSDRTDPGGRNIRINIHSVLCGFQLQILMGL